LSLGFSTDLIVPSGGVTRSIDERAGKFNGLGASLPVFLSDSIGGDDGVLKITVYGNANWTALKALIADPAPLLLVDPIAQDQRYVRLTARDWDEGVTGTGPRRQASVTYVEVAPPA
jgi:hypothetical protein